MGFFRKFVNHGSSKEDRDPSPSGPSAQPAEVDAKQKQPSEREWNHSGQQVYLPPPGPPPSFANRGPSPDTTYLPPPGPPPSYGHRLDQETANDEYLPPPGPPPSHVQPQGYPGPPADNIQHPGEDPPSYHDWQSAVPDTSLLPPPPAAANELSRTSNADSDQADLARNWCAANPLRTAKRPSPQQTQASHNGDVKLMSPGSRTNSTLNELSAGAWSGATTNRAKDLCFSTSLPLYFALGDTSPKLTGQPYTAYFEVHLNRVGAPDRDGNEPSLAIGFVAAPYPTWRMPGWERGSLAVHSDDGCRYINNQDGGLDFVTPFKPGDVVGLGVKYDMANWGGGKENALRGEAFFTRNGQVEGSWNLHEETDAADRLGNLGVVGDHDLFGAIGTYGEVGFKAVFDPQGWLYRSSHKVG